MEDRGQDHLHLHTHSDQQRSANHEPVRSRWTPKPEQILILESIFNSGMVNPPKDETVRIRKLLEKFGAVGDANVFYWFQNRRSRSRRRQRQMQATLAAGTTSSNSNSNSSSSNSSSQLIMHSGAMIHGVVGGSSSCTAGGGGGGYAQPLLSADSGSSYPNHHHQSPNDYHLMMASSSNFYGGGGLGIGPEVAADNFFPVPTTQMGGGCQSDTSNMNYPSPSGYITVFINGVATEVPRGPIDMKAVFGENAMLVHSSGVPVPVNEFGFLMQILEHGESYFLVSRPT